MLVCGCWLLGRRDDVSYYSICFGWRAGGQPVVVAKEKHTAPPTPVSRNGRGVFAFCLFLSKEANHTVRTTTLVGGATSTVQ